VSQLKVHKGQLARHSEVFADLVFVASAEAVVAMAGERNGAGLNGKEEG
jgi:hypothetical protein